MQRLPTLEVTEVFIRHTQDQDVLGVEGDHALPFMAFRNAFGIRNVVINTPPLKTKMNSPYTRIVPPSFNACLSKNRRKRPRKAEGGWPIANARSTILRMARFGRPNRPLTRSAPWRVTGACRKGRIGPRRGGLPACSRWGLPPPAGRSRPGPVGSLPSRSRWPACAVPSARGTC